MATYSLCLSNSNPSLPFYPNLPDTSNFKFKSIADAVVWAFELTENTSKIPGYNNQWWEEAQVVDNNTGEILMIINTGEIKYDGTGAAE